MMVNAVRKPNSLQVDFQGVEIVGTMVDAQIGVHSLQCLSNTKIVCAILIERDVTSEQCSFRQIVNKTLLL